MCIYCKVDLPITNDHQFQENELYQKFAFEPIVRGASAFLYFHKQGVARSLLYYLKYRRKEGIGTYLGGLYATSFSNLDVDMIVPVPLHKSKLKKRGFNQSVAFAKGLSAGMGVEINTNAVTRLVATSSQTRKGKLERWLNMENVYSEVDSSVEGKRLLVVDDVITTGATIGMLCSRLKEANCSSIYIACIARGK